jgi:endo-1,4-beta-mannosidase
MCPDKEKPKRKPPNRSSESLTKKKKYTREYHAALRELVRYHPNDPKAQRYAKRRREYSLKYSKLVRQQLRIQAINIHGTVCKLCGIDCAKENIRLEFHQIYGVKHSPNHIRDVINKPQNYAPLCARCHRSISWMMKAFNLDWASILKMKKGTSNG